MSDILPEAADRGIPAEAIGLDFVPRSVDTVATRVVGGETILLDVGSGTIHRLDPIGSVVWSTFDGSANLGLLVEELADAFGADAGVVGHDVLDLARTLARIGLLAGIAPPRAHNHAPAAPVGTEVGEELVPFRLADLDGAPVDLAELRGGPVLLVNWSPGCGFCVMIGDELGALRPTLAEQGVRLLFLAAGDEERNRALLEKQKIDVPVLLRSGAGDDFVDPFPRVGTPAAYLLDADGRVAAPLATGAYQVPGLARRAAGKAVSAARVSAVKYVAGAQEGMCGPNLAAGKSKARTWTPTLAYRVGDHHLGVRTDTPDAADIVRRFLAAHQADDDPDVPANFSVVLGAGPRRSGTAGTRKAARELKLLLQSSSTVVRSRSSRRVLLALASFLAALLPETDDGLLRTQNLAVVAGGEAVVLPPAVRVAIEPLQPRLAGVGAQLVDEPYATIDPVRWELVVPAPDLSLDLDVLDELAEGAPSRSEPPRVAAGRYPLRAWGLWDSGNPDAPALTPAEALAQALSTVTCPPDRLVATADVLADRFEAAPPVLLAATVELTDQLEPYLS